ncbi:MULTISPECIES: hypothetical protein [unclassified Oleiphilus]|nr:MULTISPECIES: hypothetical protein [unclassified Oleiphilus]
MSASRTAIPIRLVSELKSGKAINLKPISPVDTIAAKKTAPSK